MITVSRVKDIARECKNKPASGLSPCSSHSLNLARKHAAQCNVDVSFFGIVPTFIFKKCFFFLQAQRCKFIKSNTHFT